jgi:hypothetical protein
MSKALFGVPGDMPRLTSILFPSTRTDIRGVIIAAQSSFPPRGASNVIQCCGRGASFPELLKRCGPNGAKEVLRKHAVKSFGILVDDSRVLDDLDAPEDL